MCEAYRGPNFDKWIVDKTYVPSMHVGEMVRVVSPMSDASNGNRQSHGIVFESTVEALEREQVAIQETVRDMKNPFVIKNGNWYRP